MKKKILISYYDFGIGGSTTSLIALLNTIDYNKYDIDLCVFENKGDLKQYVNKNINIIEVGRKKINRFLLTLYSIFSLKIFVLLFYVLFKKSNNKKRNFAIGKTQLAAKYRALTSKSINKQYDFGIGYLEFWANEYISLQKRINKKIYWIHSDYEKSGMNLILDKSKFDKAHKIVFVSQECLNNFNGISANKYKNKAIKIENVNNSTLILKMALEKIDESVFHSNYFIIISVMRMDLYTKGLDRCIEVAKLLKNKGLQKIKWIFVGDGPDFTEFIDLITKFDLKNLIICVGKKSNPYKYIKKANLFVLLSRYEGKPVVIEEAKILHTYCLCTEYSSVHEQISNGINGTILKNDDNFNPIDAFNEIIKQYKIFEEKDKNIVNVETNDLKCIRKEGEKSENSIK